MHGAAGAPRGLLDSRPKRELRVSSGACAFDDAKIFKALGAKICSNCSPWREESGVDGLGEGGSDGLEGVD